MLKIEINDEHIEVSKRGDYTFYEQDAWVIFYGQDEKPEAHPTKIHLQLNKDQEAWPLGSYRLALSSLYRTKFSNIGLGRLKLIPATQKMAAVA